MSRPIDALDAEPLDEQPEDVTMESCATACDETLYNGEDEPENKPVKNAGPDLDTELQEAPYTPPPASFCQSIGQITVPQPTPKLEIPATPTGDGTEESPATDAREVPEEPDTQPPSSPEGGGAGDEPPRPPDHASESAEDPEDSEPNAEDDTPPKPDAIKPDREKNNPAHPEQYKIDHDILESHGGELAVLRAIDEARDAHFEQEREKTSEETHLINVVHTQIDEVASDAGADISYRMPGHTFYHFFDTIDDMVEALDEAPGPDGALYRPDGIHMVPTGDVATDVTTIARYTLEDVSFKYVVSQKARAEEETEGAEPDPQYEDYDRTQQLGEAIGKEIFNDYEKDFAPRLANPADKLPGVIDTGFYNTGHELVGFEQGFNDLLLRDITYRVGIGDIPARNAPLEVLVSGIIHEAGHHTGVGHLHAYHSLIYEKLHGEARGTALVLGELADTTTDIIYNDLPPQPNKDDVHNVMRRLEDANYFSQYTAKMVRLADQLPYIPVPRGFLWFSKEIDNFLSDH